VKLEHPDGRVEQVGSPAEVYENPGNEFVASFVGASNRLTGALARAATGSDASFLVRPEKIRLLPEGEAPEPGQCSVLGTVEEALYLGPFTRYRVRTDVPGELLVVAQNFQGGSAAAEEARGRRVRLAWATAHNRPLEGDAGRGAG
jgi:putative spermidine/putrescine transport system ATP-binding protein